MSNIDKVAIHLIEEIVAEVDPSELEILAVEGPTLIAEAMRGDRAREKREDREEFRFGIDQIVEPIKIIGIILGTVKTILDIAKMSKRPETEISVDDVAVRWE